MTQIQLKHALTPACYFNGFPHLVYFREENTVSGNSTGIFSGGDGIRNIRFSGIKNVKRVELQFNSDIVWSFENRERVNTVSIDLFQGLNIIPKILIPFTSIVACFISYPDFSNDPINISWDSVLCVGNRQLLRSVSLMGPMYLDMGGNFIQFDGGCATKKMTPVPEKQSYWKEKLDQFTDDERKHLYENKKEMDNWRIWANAREYFHKCMEEGKLITSNKVVLTDEILRLTVRFSQKRDAEIRKIFESREIEGLYISKELLQGLVRVKPNSFYMEHRNYLRFISYNEDAYNLKKKINDSWPDATVTLKETIDEDKTIQLRLQDAKDQKVKFDKYFEAMDDPTPPQEHLATDLDNAFEIMYGISQV